MTCFWFRVDSVTEEKNNMNGKGADPASLSNGKKATKVVLPQIQRHPAYYEDPYKNSILFSFKLREKQDEMLKRIV